MKISQATALIRTPLIEWVRPQDWCDLGCGTGTFTTALAELLAPGSTIHAVDLDQKALEEIPDRYDGVQIRKILGDLRNPSLRLPSVDGNPHGELPALHSGATPVPEKAFVFDGSLPDCGIRAIQAESVGTISGRLRETLRTLQRGGSGASGETGDKSISVWWHHVLGRCRTVESLKIGDFWIATTRPQSGSVRF